MVFTPSTPAVFSFSTPLSKVASSSLTVSNGIGWVSVNSFSTSVTTGFVPTRTTLFTGCFVTSSFTFVLVFATSLFSLNLAL